MYFDAAAKRRKYWDGLRKPCEKNGDMKLKDDVSHDSDFISHNKLRKETHTFFFTPCFSSPSFNNEIPPTRPIPLLHFPPPQFRADSPLIPMHQPINPLQCLRTSRHKPRTQRKQRNPPHCIQMSKDRIRVEAVARMACFNPKPVSERYSCR